MTKPLTLVACGVLVLITTAVTNVAARQYWCLVGKNKSHAYHCVPIGHHASSGVEPTFTIADAYAYAVLNWTKIHKIDMRRWPRLMAFLDRVVARPAVLRALAEEGLTQSRPGQSD